MVSFIISKITVYLNNFDDYDLKILNFLLKSGHCPNENCNRIQNSAFTLFCNGYIYNQFSDRNYFDILDLLIENGGDLNDGLISACKFNLQMLFLGQNVENNKKVIEYLINKRANPNILSINDNNISPLMIATTTKNLHNIEKLLEMGAEPDFKDKVSNFYTILNYLTNKYDNFGNYSKSIMEDLFTEDFSIDSQIFDFRIN